ncbi:MAG TPA: hypothetical protein GX718_00755, partial [Brevibacterium sp.]|nr:hypothetical protein [Brevibacterium sp.]
LQFPAIRYEDYPVSMRAHLAADAVDIVADHIYYWRERGSGDSITQSLFEPDNLKDRAHSAHLTLDVLDESANASVIRLAHQHLIDIDLVVFARALVHGTSSDFAQIEELGTQLAQRLHPQRRSGDPLGDVIHRGFLRKDLALVRAMARWRDGEGLAGLRAELPPVPRPTQARPLLRRAVSRTSFQNPLRPRRLRSALTSMTVTDDRTALVVDVRLRPQLAHRATVGVLLRDSGTEGAVPHRVTPTDTGLRLTLDVGIEDIEQHTSHSGVLELALRLTLGGMSWAGTVDANPALMSGPMLGTNCAYQWTAPRGHGLCVRRLDRVHVASVSTDGDKFVISHPHLRSPRICVVRPFPTEPARFATDDRQSRISADVLLDDPPDEPVTGVVERKVVVERRPGDAPLLLVGEPAVIVRDNRQVEIARDGWGFLTVRHSWAGMDVEDTAAAVAEVADHDAGGGHVPPELGGSTSTAAEEEVLPED